MQRLSCLLPLVAAAACVAHVPPSPSAGTAPTPAALERSADPGAPPGAAREDGIAGACPAPEPGDGQPAPAGIPPVTGTTVHAGVSPAPAGSCAAPEMVAGGGAAADESDDDESEGGGEDELESIELVETSPGLHYTAELDDASLARAWEHDLGALGSISIGFAHQGRVVNAVQFPPGEGYVVVRPEAAWATQETVDHVLAAIRRVRVQHPEAPPLRVNQISAKEGGWLRPHLSHQSGRDVDLAFYYPTPDPIRVREREKVIDVALTWALLEALIVESDVQVVLVDSRVQRVLYAHALAEGRDKGWLDSIFHAGSASLVKHARRHRDHFHVRFYNARAQELGRRVAPLLALRPEQHVTVHRVRSGDTLGHIALRYGTTVRALQKENGLKGTFLSLGQRIRVRLRGPCTNCPIPPAVVVPPRRLPPAPPALVSHGSPSHGG